MPGTGQGTGEIMEEAIRAETLAWPQLELKH